MTTTDWPQRIITELQARYGTTPERPWRTFPRYCTFKTNTNQKWYAIIMDIRREQLGLNGDAVINIINVKALPARVQTLIDYEHYFPAYHMNRRHWLTVLLDDTTDWAQLEILLADSYHLVAGTK